MPISRKLRGSAVLPPFILSAKSRTGSQPSLCSGNGTASDEKRKRLETTNQVRYQIGVSGDCSRPVVRRVSPRRACPGRWQTPTPTDNHTETAMTAARIPMVDYFAKGVGPVPMSCCTAALPKRLDNCDWAANCTELAVQHTRLKPRHGRHREKLCVVPQPLELRVFSNC